MTKQYVDGTLYKIRFYDHAIGSTEGMICETVGWCLSDNDRHVVLTYWIVDTTDKDIKEYNVEPCSIIKSCIIRSKKLS